MSLSIIEKKRVFATKKRRTTTGSTSVSVLTEMKQARLEYVKAIFQRHDDDDVAEVALYLFCLNKLYAFVLGELYPGG